MTLTASHTYTHHFRASTSRHLQTLAVAEMRSHSELPTPQPSRNYFSIIQKDNSTIKSGNLSALYNFLDLLAHLSSSRFLEKFMVLDRAKPNLKQTSILSSSH